MSGNSGTRSSGARRQTVRREVITASRFGLVGAFATSLHMLVVWLLIDRAGAPVFLANLMAFLAAFGVSFTGNYWWTFCSPGSPKTAARRFFLISGSAFVANNLLLGLLIASKHLSPAIAAISAAAVIPVMTYGASRLWGFGAGSRSA